MVKRHSTSFKLVLRQNLNNNFIVVENFFKNKTFENSADDFFSRWIKFNKKLKIKEPHPNSEFFKDYIRVLSLKRRRWSFIKIYFVFLKFVEHRKLYFYFWFILFFLIYFYKENFFGKQFNLIRNFFIQTPFDLTSYLIAFNEIFK